MSEKSINELSAITANTVFNTEYDLKHNRFRTEYISKGKTKIIIEDLNIDNGTFVKIYDKIHVLINMYNSKEYCLDEYNNEKDKPISAHSIALLMFIISKLRINCNFVKFTIKEACDYTMLGKNSILAAINNLDEHCIIRKTTNNSIYVINHNYIFKGSLEDFIEAYNKLYDGKRAKLDKLNRIILGAVEDNHKVIINME